MSTKATNETEAMQQNDNNEHNDNEEEMEILDAKTLENLEKEDLIKYTVNLTKLFTKISKFVQSSKETASELAIVKNVNTLLTRKMDTMERNLENIQRTTTKNGQYLRNKQMEVKMLSPDIVKLPINTLRTKMATLMSQTGVKVKASDIDKCHPLGSSGTSVILEFNYREKRDEVLRSRKELKNKKKQLEENNFTGVMILESLCREYSRLDYICRKLKSNGCIQETWFFNGRLYVKEREQSEKVEISHINDILTLVDIETLKELVPTAL